MEIFFWYFFHRLKDFLAHFPNMRDDSLKALGGSIGKASGESINVFMRSWDRAMAELYFWIFSVSNPDDSLGS